MKSPPLSGVFELSQPLQELELLGLQLFPLQSLLLLAGMELLKVFCGPCQDGYFGGFGAVGQPWDLVPQREEARAQVVPPLSLQEVVRLTFVRVLTIRGLGAGQVGRREGLDR